MDRGLSSSTTSTRRLRIALVDDHAVVRAGYRRLVELEDDMEMVADFPDAERAYAAMARGGVRTDILVADLSLPDWSGLELMRRLRPHASATRTVVFSMHCGAAIVRQCLRAGARAFVSKTSPPEFLVGVLRRVANGEVVLSSDLSAEAENDVDLQCDHLSATEFSILQRLVAGRGLDDIARAVHLSTRTVANYQSDIRRKLGLRSAADLLDYARRHRIVPL